MADRSLLVDGAKKLSTAFLLLIIASIIVIGCSAAVAVSVYASLAPLALGFKHVVPAATSAIAAAMGSIIALIVGGIIGFILVIVSFIELYRGFSSLKAYDESRYGIGSTGAKLEVIGMILYLIGLVLALAIAFVASFTATAHKAPTLMPSPAATVLAGAMAGLITLFVGGIIVIIGAVMILIGLWRLGDEPGGSLLKASSILWIIGAILLIIYTSVGCILLLIAAVLGYIGARGVAREALRAETSAQSA